MDDLLYLMAHAPAEPPDWFEPAIEPPPPSAKHPINPTDQEREELRGLGDWLSPEEATCPRVKAYGAELDAARIAYAAWKSRYYRERYLQWPRAWAEEMLRRRYHWPQANVDAEIKRRFPPEPYPPEDR